MFVKSNEYPKNALLLYSPPIDCDTSYVGCGKSYPLCTGDLRALNPKGTNVESSA